MDVNEPNLITQQAKLKQGHIYHFWWVGQIHVDVVDEYQECDAMSMRVSVCNSGYQNISSFTNKK